MARVHREDNEMMCRILIRREHDRFLKVTRSIRIAGHSTSIRLEGAFWDTLDDMATVEGVPRARLIEQLHHEAVERHGVVTSLASMLRTVCLLYQQEKIRPAPSGPRQV